MKPRVRGVFSECIQCGNVPVVGWGLCAYHYRLDHAVERRVLCAVVDCEGFVHTRIWCLSHYGRWLKYGDAEYYPPRSGPGSSSWSGDRPSYGALHRRLDKEFGRASDYLCWHCSGPARDWAYDREDPNELTEEIHNCQGSHTVKYSLNFDRYFPLCRPCHAKFDLKTHCKHGHEFTEENTRIGPNGVRLCRTCGRERQRAHRLRKKEKDNR